MDIVRPPSTGTGSVTVDYFSAILHALLPNLNIVELPPSIGANSTQIDYLHAIWKATQANGTLNIPPYDNDTAAIAGGLIAGQLYYKPDGSVWVLKPLDQIYAYDYYGGNGFSGIGSKHLYLSLDSLEADLLAEAKARTAKEVDLQNQINHLKPFADVFNTPFSFVLPAYTVLSKVVIMPIDTMTNGGVGIGTHMGSDSILFLPAGSNDLAIGGGINNPFELNLIYPVDMEIFIGGFYGKRVFFKFILE